MGVKLLTGYCGECRYCSVRVRLNEETRKRLDELKGSMSILERQSRGLPEPTCGWCSLWRLTVDPLEKSCYKWRRTRLNPRDVEE